MLYILYDLTLYNLTYMYQCVYVMCVYVLCMWVFICIYTCVCTLSACTILCQKRAFHPTTDGCESHVGALNC